MRLRSLDAPADEAGLRAVFRSTLLLGDPMPARAPVMDRYERLCLDWYLTVGRADAAVLDPGDGTVAGYALVCTDEPAYRRWARRRGLLFGAVACAGLATGRYRAPVRKFVRNRLRDGWELRAAGAPTEGLGHAHINLLPTARAARGGRMLAEHVDARVRAAGLDGWYGEINAVDGTRAAALTRLGGEIVGKTPNRTLTAMTGRPVSRLTVVRSLLGDTSADVA